ncbi:MAG TPA: MoxR family ATPase [Bryobacteraceae bacterium]|nr:MoxR family ATPase [Bryobacteraceae bacterium]
MNLEQMQQALAVVRAEIHQVVIGQEMAVDHALVAILCGQHALLEGVPGVAKTLLARTMAVVMGGSFQRIQFTPDLMPADITGTSIFNLQRNEFTFAPGPIFADYVLADEINRAPAKTQSALLEAMQERQVTLDRHTYPLPAGFTVFATQNPIEFEGTYPLAEAQKDRFMLKIRVPLPNRETELTLAHRMLTGDAPEKRLVSGSVRALLSGEWLTALRGALEQVRMREELVGYVLDVVRRTRQEESVLVGAGPRATQALLGASRANAALAMRDFVTPDDVKAMAPAVLEHRLILRPEFEVEGLTVEEAVKKILASVPVPA